MRYGADLYMCVHFPHSSRSVQRLCPSAVISLKRGKGDIIVCCRLFHSRQSVSVWLSSSPVSALLYNTISLLPSILNVTRKLTVGSDAALYFQLYGNVHTPIYSCQEHTPTLPAATHTSAPMPSHSSQMGIKLVSQH